jgi:predicted nucleic acid-binding protein
VIFLDTNVVSELTKPLPDPWVIAWMNSQILENLFITAITIAEMRFGIMILPEGKRREQLDSALSRSVALFEDRIVPFDTLAADAYALLASNARSDGHGLPIADGYIAAIALSRQFTLATRDAALLRIPEIRAINPLEAQK